MMDFDLVREAVIAIRRLRAEYRIPPNQEIVVYIVPKGDR